MSSKLTQPISIENENLLNKDKIILENINEEIKETKGIYHQSKAVNETVIKKSRNTQNRKRTIKY